MKCPHCLENFHDAPVGIFVGQDDDGESLSMLSSYPACRKMLFHLQTRIISIKAVTEQSRNWQAVSARLIRPKGSARPPCAPEVPKSLSTGYTEAATVLPDSAKAAAALGRRCLQNLLREHVKVKPGNLFDEIQQVLDSGKLPSGLHESIDAVRNIGNFAAHPIKSKQTGLIVDVEPGEAEWTLDVLEELFDFYFVLPSVIQKKKDALDRKLRKLGNLQ